MDNSLEALSQEIEEDFFWLEPDGEAQHIIPALQAQAMAHLWQTVHPGVRPFDYFSNRKAQGLRHRIEDYRDPMHPETMVVFTNVGSLLPGATPDFPVEKTGNLFRQSEDGSFLSRIQLKTDGRTYWWQAAQSGQLDASNFSSYCAWTMFSRPDANSVEFEYEWKTGLYPTDAYFSHHRQADLDRYEQTVEQAEMDEDSLSSIFIPTSNGERGITEWEGPTDNPDILRH